MAAMPEINVPPTVGIIVRPGDTLLVCAQPNVTAEQANHIHAGLLKLLPQLADVVIVAGATALAAYRPSAEGTPQ